MISVIVPTRSRSANLVNTLEALTNQSLPRDQYEIIVSDDNSKDDTQKVINQFSGRGRFKYVFNNHKPHTWNASIPRNLGASISDQGYKYLVFIDSDVIAPHTALETYLKHMQKNDLRVMIGPYHWRGQNGQVAKNDDRWPSFLEKNPDDTYARATDGLACFGGNLCIPKNIFWSVGGFSPDIHIGLEDGDMGLKLWKVGTKFSYDKDLLGYHQWHETPSDRFPPNMKEHIDNLNMKHFHTKNPDYGIIEASREAYADWGITGWEAPAEWKANQLSFMLKVNK